MRALHTAASGMKAQELTVEVISNNIANMRTTGFKRQRAEFQDMLYDHQRRAGTQNSQQGNLLPVGISIGSGVKPAGTSRIMTQGNVLATDKDYDVAIRGEGFFRISLPDGRTAYTATAPSSATPTARSSRSTATRWSRRSAFPTTPPR